ncbi:hypothetical protein BYT27DRAFT_6741031 [Phlegmacium glaucopus]|nr:hypothetical protein BYT27DRAFT_6741031 [Phlegmacium glaucopus]
MAQVDLENLNDTPTKHKFKSVEEDSPIDVRMTSTVVLSSTFGPLDYAYKLGRTISDLQVSSHRSEETKSLEDINQLISVWEIALKSPATSRILCVVILIFGTGFCVGIYDRDGVTFPLVFDMFRDKKPLFGLCGPWRSRN